MIRNLLLSISLYLFAMLPLYLLGCQSATAPAEQCEIIHDTLSIHDTISRSVPGWATKPYTGLYVSASCSLSVNKDSASVVWVAPHGTIRDRGEARFEMVSGLPLYYVGRTPFDLSIVAGTAGDVFDLIIRPSVWDLGVASETFKFEKLQRVQ